MRKTLLAAAAVLVTTVLAYLAIRTPSTESSRGPEVEPQPVDAERVETAEGVSASQTARRDLVADDPLAVETVELGSRVLRVVLEGITGEAASAATIGLKGVDERHAKWPAELQPSWPCQGLTSEFDLDPFFASVAERGEALRVEELWVSVDQPDSFLEWVEVPLAPVEVRAPGQSVYEVRVQLDPPAYWPEVTLDVRDADTHEHLEDVELSSVSVNFMNTPRRPGLSDVFTTLGDGLSSPIVLQGGRRANDANRRLAGIRVRPAPGEAPQLSELWHNGRVPPEQGVLVYVRAPEYTWRVIALDLSAGAENEVLLEKDAAALDVRLTNVQRERYAAMETTAFLTSWYKAEGQESWFWADGESPLVLADRLDETLESEGLRLEGLDPGEYLFQVELRGGEWKEWPVIAREELTLVAGESRELRLPLDDPPAPPGRATLAGVLGFPAFGGQERVRLQLYHDSSWYRHPHLEYPLSDMVHVGGALPTWSFRIENLPVGLYRVQVLPFMNSWVIELPAEGREDVELLFPDLAEVLVETVDARTGELVPLEEVFFRNEEELPGEARSDWAAAELEEPGRFRIWSAPGPTSIYANEIPSGLDYGTPGLELELVPGFQSVRLELEPLYAFRLEFRIDGTAISNLDDLWREALDFENLRPIGHEGEVTSVNRYRSERVVEVSAPGLYELSFEGVGADRFHPIPPQRFDVRAGETAEVIVELQQRSTSMRPAERRFDARTRDELGPSTRS